jgi:hypothetical protein
MRVCPPPREDLLLYTYTKAVFKYLVFWRLELAAVQDPTLRLPRNASQTYPADLFP